MISNSKKLELIYKTYDSWLLTVVYPIVKNREIAQDVVQTVYVKILEHIDQVHDPLSTDTKVFCAIVARNHAYNIVNYEKRHRMEDIELYQDIIADHEGDIFDQLLEKLNYDEALAKVKKLPERLRYIFWMKYSYELNYTDIADLLDITPDNARQIYRRARIKLMHELEGVWENGCQ